MLPIASIRSVDRTEAVSCKEPQEDDDFWQFVLLSDVALAATSRQDAGQEQPVYQRNAGGAMNAGVAQGIQWTIQDGSLRP